MRTKNYDRMMYGSWDKVRNRRTDGQTDDLNLNLMYAHVTFSKWRLKSKYEKPRLKSIYLFLFWQFISSYEQKTVWN